MSDDARQSTGGSSKVMRSPRPRVTAEIPSGSIALRSIARPSCGEAAVEAMTSTARTTANPVAIEAVVSDVTIARAGSMPSRNPGRIDVSRRFDHPEALNFPFTVNDP